MTWDFLPRLKPILTVVFVLLLIVGTALVFVSHVDVSNSTYSSQAVLCSQTYNTKIPALETRQSSCKVSPGDWIELSFASRFDLTVSVWLDPPASVVPAELLYNHTSTVFSSSIPITSGGIAIAKLTNLQSNSSSLIQGTLQVFNQSSYAVSVSTVVYPYRTVGYGFLGISIIGLFLLIWKPKFLPWSSTPKAAPLAVKFRRE